MTVSYKPYPDNAMLIYSNTFITVGVRLNSKIHENSSQSDQSILQFQVLQHQLLPQLNHKLLGVVVQQLLHDLDDLVRVRTTQQLLLHQGDELLLDAAHVLFAHLFQPRPDLPLEDRTLGELVPVDAELPQVHLVLGHLPLQLFDGLAPALLFLYVYFFMLDFWEVELNELFLFWLLVYLLVAFEELVLGKLLWLGSFVVLDGLGRLHQNFFYFFLAEDDILFGDYFDPADLGRPLLGQHLLLGKGWIFFHHNLIVLLLFPLDLLPALLGQELGDSLFKFFLVEVQLFF